MLFSQSLILCAYVDSSEWLSFAVTDFLSGAIEWKQLIGDVFISYGR
jgi:hypothetical protein